MDGINKRNKTRSERSKSFSATFSNRMLSDSSWHSFKMEEIDYIDIVREEMAPQRPEVIPRNLQDQLLERWRYPEGVQRALCDSQSRQANSNLRSDRLHEEVHLLCNPNGEVSEQFPETLGDIFAVSDTSLIGHLVCWDPFSALRGTAKALLEEHREPGMLDLREKNINAFMCHGSIRD
ncbi:hypothetical protein V8D89_002949 [Ganoderma adspersum]